MAKKKRKKNPVYMAEDIAPLTRDEFDAGMDDLLTMTPEDAELFDEVSEEVVAENIPQIVDLLDSIKDEVSDMVGYDVGREHPGIDKTILRVIKQRLL